MVRCCNKMFFIMVCSVIYECFGFEDSDMVVGSELMFEQCFCYVVVCDF